MAADPHAFYRGSACLFYADVTQEEDPYADERSGRIWIHGDLHVENFGTYLNSDGRMVFDVNDFDEAYLGRFTWDLQRFAASLALVGWQKALPEDDVRRADRRATCGPTSRRSTSTARARRRRLRPAPRQHRPGRSTQALVTARMQQRADLLDDDHHRRRRRPDAARGRLRAPPRQGASGPGSWPPSRATSTRSRRTSASTARCSTTCATWPARAASASAAPASRRTTCWSRATARRSTTTSCCR